MIPDATAALRAALIDRYRIERELGVGGMATVYLAEDVKHKRKVAIKVLRDELAAALGPERFLREIETTANLRHPHILPLYDSGQAGGFLYYVMPFIDGESLRDRLCREKPFAIDDALQITREVADALGYAHNRGVIHRDIKPENILLENGHAVVADFGIAKAVSGLDGGHLTQTGLAVGTPAYMSPEQVLADSTLDGRSDLYSLGCVLFEMLTGEPPFAAATSQRTIARRLTEAPPEVSARQPSVPRAVSQVVSRCLAREPDERWATGAQLTEALRKSATGSIAATTTVDSGAERARSRLPWVAVLSFATRDPELADLAEGLAEDVTTGLSRFSHLQVVARQSAANLPAGTDVRRVGELLGARFVIEGSIRKSGTTMRLSAQLVDAQTGTHLWAETFDRDLSASSIFALQDELTDRIVATVADSFGVLVRLMARPLLEKPVEELTATELIIRLYAHNQQLVPEEHARLRRGLELAVEREPNHADAWAALSSLYWGEQQHGLNPLPDSIGRALRAAQRAVQLDQASQIAWEGLAQVQYFSGDLSGFRQSAERALALNPRNTATLAMMGMLSAFGGDWDRGMDLVRQAMALNPHHAGWFYFVPFHFHFKRREYEKAYDAVKRVNMPELPWSYTSTAMVCAELGRWDEACAAVEGLRRLAPGLESALKIGDMSNGWFFDADLMAREAESWRKAVAGPPVAAAATPATQSVAVLPFANMSADPQDEFFADGITEEIINALAQLPGLRVAARTSCFAFKGKNEDLRTVGEKLGVDSVLEGSVRKAGSKLRITAQLINVADGYHLWSERYDREMTDIFAVQDEIAGAIAAKLQLGLSGKPATPLPRQAPANIEAYELLLKGRVLLGRRGRAILEARVCLERAVALDPGLAEAHALLGDCFRLIGMYGIASCLEMMPMARTSAERALELDPEQPEALGTLANVTANFDWNTERSLELSSRALAREPTNVRALAERAIIVAVREAAPEEMERALQDLRTARGIDPLNSWAAAMEGFGLCFAGRPAEALAAARSAVDLDAENFTARWVTVLVLAALSRHDEALAAAEPALLMSGRNPRILAEVAAVHAARGDVAGAEAVYQEVRGRAQTGYIGWAEQGAIAASAGRFEEARALLRQAIEARDVFLVFWKLPSWGPVRNDPEGNLILRSTGI